MSKTVSIAYYKTTKNIEIEEDNLIDVLLPREIHKAEDLTACMDYNLDHPIGTAPFNELCRGKKQICIMVCDLTRPMQTDRVLPILLERIEQSSPGAHVDILIALGTHRPLSAEEIDIVCGKGIKEKYNVVNHRFDDPEALVFVEGSREDFPIYVNKLLYESDFKVAIGAVKPHPIYGWSGGAKMVVPGVAGYMTTGLTHWESCPYKGIEIMGRVENNVRGGVEKIIGEAGLLDFVVNAVLTEGCEIADVRCGDFVKAHRACVKLAQQYYIREVEEPADAVIVGAGKWAQDLWIGAMSIYQSEFYVKNGGTIVFLGNLPEGISPTHPEIAKWGYRPYSEVKKLVEAGELGDDMTLAAHLVHTGRVLENRNAQCWLMSEGVSREAAGKLGFQYIERVDEIIPRLKEKYGDSVRILAIPGFSSTPVVAEHPIP